MRKIIERLILHFSRLKTKALKIKFGAAKILFLLMGFISLFWILIRVIPKPSRASYPCMRVSMPFASAFIAYMAALSSSLFFFRKSIRSLRANRILVGIGALAFAIVLGTISLIRNEFTANAITSPDKLFTDPLGPNAPIGEAKGVIPGRVVWVYNPNATNENCTNLSLTDVYWLAENTDQNIVDQMFSDGIKSLTDKESDAEAWDAIFRYFNQNHDKGDIGYTDTETIFIKINAVTAWGGAWPDGEVKSNDNIEYDTSPQAILTLLKQLVNMAGVPQEKIFIGDPIADIYNHIYDYLHEEFPHIHYCTGYNVPSRYDYTSNSTKALYFSDKGTVMPEIDKQDNIYNEMLNADYLLNIPTMKGHRWAGVTFFAKNHFGSNTSGGSWLMHPGLINNDNKGMRTDYNMYRVLVDIMGSEKLGRKTLLYFMEALWSTSYEHQPPQKFQSSPFNNDWSSSILLSLDPVAIESVCLDILQKEFTEEKIVDGMDKPWPDHPDRWIFVQFDGIDDYLHQAASSDWWPEGITYDPDNSGSPIPSLGVHEHWNNTTDMQYSRNLGTDDGIELVKIFEAVNTLDPRQLAANLRVFPNPCNEIARITWVQKEKAELSYELIDLQGRVILADNDIKDNGVFKELTLDVSAIQPGVYFIALHFNSGMRMTTTTERIIIN
jgi:hypothetical protein